MTALAHSNVKSSCQKKKGVNEILLDQEPMVSRVSNVLIVSSVKPGAIASCKLSKLVVYFFFLPFARVLSTPPLGDAAVLKAPLPRNWPTRREEEFCKEMDEVRQRIVADTTIKENTTASSEDME